MVFKIDTYQSGSGTTRFKIVISEQGFETIRADAQDLQEVGYALEHYFNYRKHIDHSKTCDCCPLCRKK